MSSTCINDTKLIDSHLLLARRINAVFYYSGMFFEGVIENPLVATTLMGGINVIATYVALLIMDRCGRKTLIMWSSVGMFISCIFVVLALKGYFSSVMSIVSVAAYVTFFEIGLGPIPVSPSYAHRFPQIKHPTQRSLYLSRI